MMFLYVELTEGLTLIDFNEPVLNESGFLSMTSFRAKEILY